MNVQGFVNSFVSEYYTQHQKVSRSLNHKYFYISQATTHQSLTLPTSQPPPLSQHKALPHPVFRGSAPHSLKSTCSLYKASVKAMAAEYLMNSICCSDRLTPAICSPGNTLALLWVWEDGLVKCWEALFSWNGWQCNFPSWTCLAVPGVW